MNNKSVILLEHNYNVQHLQILSYIVTVIALLVYRSYCVDFTPSNSFFQIFHCFVNVSFSLQNLQTG